jgi:DNA-binding transcriptional MocR family regulator
VFPLISAFHRLTEKRATGKLANLRNPMDLSNRIASIEGSKTVALTGLIQKLAREGKQIIDLAVGEVGFDTPAPIIDATQKALAALKTRYGPVAGLAELRQRLADQFPGWGPENILVSNGAKQVLCMIFQCLCNPGDPAHKDHSDQFSQQPDRCRVSTGDADRSGPPGRQT